MEKWKLQIRGRFPDRRTIAVRLDITVRYDDDMPSIAMYIPGSPGAC